MTVQLSMFGARYNGKHADLFVTPACPLPEPAPQPPVAPTAPEAPASPADPEVRVPALVFSFGSVEIHRQACCPECGDVLSPRAKVCPNCYTMVEKGGKGDG